MIVTVTLNAAIDRTLTVPNFQRGQRHRASAGVTLAGGKGINVARALKTLGVPVVATGLVGGQTGTRIVEQLTDEAILNDFVHIDGESRTSTAVVDPTGGTYTEINEWGPAVLPDELDTLLEKLRYLTQGARAGRLRGLAAARRRRRLLCRGGARARAAPHPDGDRQRGRAAADGGRGGAVPRLAEPGRGRGARRPGVPRRRGLPHRARDARRDGPAQRAHHDRAGLRRAAARGSRGAPVPRARATRRAGLRGRLRRRAARRRSSPRGTPAARTRRRCAPPSPPGRRRRSRSGPDASTRGRPGRLQAGVELSELEPVQA